MIHASAVRRDRFQSNVIRGGLRALGALIIAGVGAEVGTRAIFAFVYCLELGTIGPSGIAYGWTAILLFVVSTAVTLITVVATAVRGTSVLRSLWLSVVALCGCGILFVTVSFANGNLMRIVPKSGEPAWSCVRSSSFWYSLPSA